MGENVVISKNELEKTNEIVSNINRKLLTELIQYLTAKNFYINPDKSQYSSYSYHPDELVEPFVGDSVANNVPQRSKKWVALEDMTLLNNWSNFLADQPPQFRRLSAILLKKPCSYNILTDTLYFNNDSGKGNNSSLCGTIKIKQLIIEYNRMKKLYARLGKGICRCLNSCYYRAKLVLVGSGNPQVTGPFSEPEAHLCYNLYKSLQLNPNHTLDYVCEQIGKSLNRPPQLIALFLETLEQIKGNSILKITYSPPKNTTNTLNSVSNTIPSLPFASQSFHNELTAPIPTPPKQPISMPTIGSDNQFKDRRPPMPTCPNLVALESVAPGNPYVSLNCRRDLTQGIKAYTWPSKVNDVLVQIIKWHYNSKLDFDFKALAKEVAPQVLRSTISCLQIDWTTILRTLIKNCTTLPPCYLDPCIEIFDYYWKHKLRQLYLNLTDDKTVNNAQPGPVYYERAYLDSFFTRLRVFVALNKPEKAKHALLISVILRSCPTLGAPFKWEKVTQLYNAESTDATPMTEEQLKIMFDDMKQTYVHNHTFLTARKIIRDLSAILIGGKNQGGKKKDKSQCLDNTNSLDFNHTFKDRDEPNVPKIVEIKDEDEIIEPQSAIDNAHESKHLLKDSPNSTAKTKKKHSKIEDKVRLKKGRSHSSDNLKHEEIESEAMPLEPEIPSKIKGEVDKSDSAKFFERADFRSEAELMGKDKTISETKNGFKKSKSESSENNAQLSESMAKQELSEIRRSLFKNYRKFEIFIKKNRMNLMPEQLRLYKSTLVSLCDEGFLDRVKTDPTVEICKKVQNINNHSQAKEQLHVDEDIPKLKRIKKLKDIKAENIELEVKILELPDSIVKKKPKNITDSTVKSQIVENKLEVCDRKSLKQKSLKSKTPQIIEFADMKSDCIKKRCKDEEIVDKRSETSSKKSVKVKKRETEEFSTEKKKSRKKEKIEAQELNMDDNQREVKPDKEITNCKKLDFESTGSTHEEITKDATKKLKKSKKASISEVDNQETSLNLEPSSHKKKHKVKVAHHVNDEDKDVLIKVKKSKVKKAESLDNVDEPMCILDADQNESNVSVESKLEKKERTLIDRLNNGSVVEIPRKKKSKKTVELNDDCQKTTPKIKKRDKKVKAIPEATKQISPSPKDLQPFQEVLKTSSKRRKSKTESESQGDPSAFAKTENTNVNDDEPIQILSPAKINVTRDNAKKHLVITIEDSDDICEMEDDCRQTLGADKFKSIESIKLQKLIEALGNNPNNQYHIINEIRKTVKLRSTL